MEQWPRAILSLLAIIQLTSCDSNNLEVADAGATHVPPLAAPPISNPGPLVDPACRPVDQPRMPGAPLLLPCAKTVEPCDGVDNDGDGFLDPHCPTIPCTSDADCTYGGALPDADCNFWGDPHPVCNQIDGGEHPTALACQGMLCPPGLKCVAGDCYEPGDKPPEAPCSFGAECPLNAGCIPHGHGDYETSTCRTFCHDTPCPDGAWCTAFTWRLNGRTLTQSICTTGFGCPRVFQMCGQALDGDDQDPDSALIECIHEDCRLAQDCACVLGCAARFPDAEPAACIRQWSAYDPS